MSGARLSSLVIAVVFSLVTPAAGRADTHRPTSYVLFIDCSPSVTASQLQRWIQEGHGQIARLAAGDALQIFLLHDNTATAAAVFADQAPVDDTLSARRRLAGLRERGRAAFACPSSQTPGRNTDVLSAIDRVHALEGRETVIAFFSDMLNSMPEIDIERRLLPVERIPRVIESVARNHHWTRDTLKGVTVFCVLNSLDQGQRSPSPNDRRTLETFYRALFDALGGRLERFDTSLASFAPVSKGR